MEPPEAANTPQQNANRSTPRISVIPLVVVALVIIATGVWFKGLGSYLLQRVAYTPAPPTFSGSSESLQQTVIVPTLDSPCPPNKNVIWCSSFQLAWNEVRDKVIGAPLQVVGAEEIAARLNQAKQSTLDLEPSSFYAAGSRIGEGIIAKIKKDMAARFPSHPLPDLDQYGDAGGGILAYSYLTANVAFKYPFLQARKPFAFTDSRGGKANVDAFGLWGARGPQYRNMREQVAVLYSRRVPDKRALKEYAIDLCRHSQPYEVVVAVVEPKGSLAETLEHVRLQVEQLRTSPYAEGVELGERDILAVPQMTWRIDRRFRELIGKLVANANPAMPIVEAMQTVQFRLDRCGAAVESEAKLSVKALPREFLFNRPFLVYMQKRGAEQPFFVMWVDNAELLTRK